MSSPFPTEFVASPAGGRVAWVFDARGLRNIWVAEPSGGGSYQSRQLTRYTQDDGQDVGELTWTPDGRAIVYVRGGDFENDGAYPNPASAPEGVEQDIWVVSVEGGAPRKLGEGHSPAVSPKGDSVVYIFKDQVWRVKLAAGAKPEQLIHDKGKDSSLRWSPDGSMLAFVSRRGDHSFVGVYNLSGKSLLYLDPSVDRDSEPVWSPDSKQVAFLRLPARDEFIPGSRRAGQPWSIRVADAATGQGHEVWRADTGARQRLPRDCGRVSDLLGGRRQPGFSLGARRLDSSLFRSRCGRRGKAPHARRFRSGVRFPQSRSPAIDFGLEPG